MKPIEHTLPRVRAALNPITKPYLLAYAVLLLGLLGCSSIPKYQGYDGPAKPAKEIASVFIPKEFNLLNVDGKSYVQPLMSQGTEVTLLPGSHKIIIKYVDFWLANPDSDEKIVSQPMLFSFDAGAGDKFKVQFRELKDIEDARRFATNPSIALLDRRSGSAVPADITYKLKSKGFVAAFMDSISPTPEPPVSPETAKQKAPALEMLKYWWQKASAQQQEDFMKWVVEK